MIKLQKMYNQTEFTAIHIYRVADTVIGTIYIACFIFGVPANLLSLIYFTRDRFQTVDLPTCLYTITALQDTVISLLSLKHGITLLRRRVDVFKGFCPVHHVLFRMSQRMSVFLVATLSMTRTYSLVYPLRMVSTKSVLKLLALVCFLMTCYFVVPASAGIMHISYHFNDGYCWAEPIAGNKISQTWDKIHNVMETVGLACPVVPIIVSCVVSAVKIQSSISFRGSRKRRSLRRSESTSSSLSSATSKKATITIIIVTAVYIIFNIPLFINYVLFVISILCYSYPGPIYDTVVMYYYFWNVTDLLNTALNASANPIVYFTRFQRFRSWSKAKLNYSSWRQKTFELISKEPESARKAD